MMKTSRFVVQPVLENEFQPMIRQKEADVLIDFFGHPEPIAAKQLKSTRATKPQTSARVSKTTHITISDSALNDPVQSYAKSHNRTGYEIAAFLCVLILLSFLFVGMKYRMEN